MAQSQTIQLPRVGMFAIVRNRRGVVAVVESYEGRDRCITEETMPAIASFDHFKAAQRERLGV